MTIEKGQPWGAEVPRPDDLRTADGDAELAAALSAGDAAPVAVATGDMHRTVGARSVGDRKTLMALPLDLVVVTLDDGAARPAVAHVVAREPWWRGGWWRGPVLAVMNAEFLGEWDVAPRGHPNDGRVETQLAAPSMSIRDRWQARRRLGQGTHVPHPDIATRSVRSATWTFDHGLVVVIDGQVAGRSRSVAVEVRPDAGTLHA